MNSLVSVIIPNFNYSKYISFTIESVLKQSYKNLECIVVDDGSTDNSLDIVKKHEALDNRVKLVAKTNGGLSSARNEGIKNAKGDWIAFLDSDDLWEVDKLKNQIEMLQKDSTIDIMYSNCVNFNEQNEETITEHVFEPYTPLKFIETNSMPGCSSSFIIKRQLIEKAGLFDHDLRGSEDHDFLFRCALAGGKFAYCNKVDVKIRKHSTSMLTNYRKMFFNNWYCLEKDMRLFEKSGQLKNYTQKQINKALELRIQALRWLARNDEKKDLIFVTYSIGIAKIGWAYLFRKFTLSNIKYDFVLLYNYKKQKRNQ